MKELWVTIVLASSILTCPLSCQNHKPVKQMEVSINPNIETIACLFNLTPEGSSTGYSYGTPPLRKAAMDHFSYLKDHPAVKRTADFLRMGFWLNNMVEVALYCSPFPEGKLQYELSEKIYEGASPNKNIEDGKWRINEYIKLVNNFYRDAYFGDFIQQHQDQYRKIEEEVRQNLPDKSFIQVMEQYYGRKNKSYALIPSPLVPELMGFGVQIILDEGAMLFNIFGSFVKRAVMDSIKEGIREFKLDDYTFDYPEEIRELSVHEFGHSFVDPYAEKYRDYINRYKYLFEPIRERMTQIGYNNWWTCVDEHIVRAGEVRIAIAMGNMESAKNLKLNYMSNFQFIYLPYLIESMKVYEMNRSQFKSFGEYFPELLRTFGEIDTSEIKRFKFR